MKDHFPSLELVFDAFSPFYVWANNHRVALTRIGAATHWALRRGKALENWAEGIRLLDECIPSFAQTRVWRTSAGCALYHYYPKPRESSIIGLGKREEDPKGLHRYAPTIDAKPT
jgi:hypothetical protein